MSREHVDHKQIQDFADNTVNLKKEDAKEYREQVNRLRDRIKDSVKGNDDFELKKTLLSGSLAKHTALRTINDADVAVYVISDDDVVGGIIDWLAEELRSIPNLNYDQVREQNYSVRIEFRGTGLAIDVVPVYQTDQDKDDWGSVFSQKDGTKLKTNITLHKEFIKKYREKYTTYAQVVRLLKWWAKIKKEENENFKFKSFMIELVLAKLYDENHFNNPSDYPETILDFFNYIVRADFKKKPIYFTNYVSRPSSCDDIIQVFDPVNETNNIARKYTEYDRDIIVDEALDAGDAIGSALRAMHKTDTVRYWRKIFGPSFNI